MITARPPGFRQFGKLGQQPVQGREFVVDRDPQCLEGAGGRVDRSAAPRHAAPDQVGELAGRRRSARASRASTIRRAIRRLNRSSPNW